MSRGGGLYQKLIDCAVCIALAFGAVLSANSADAEGIVGEPTPIDPKYQSLVQDSLNIITDPKRTLEPIFQKLRDRKKGDQSVISIVHIGDSHIQGGGFTDAVREELQRQFGDAGIGVIAPLKIASTNQPKSYSIVSPNRWTSFKCIDRDPSIFPGVTAMAISTADRNIEFAISAKEPFSVVKVFATADSPVLHASDQMTDNIECYDPNIPTLNTIMLNTSTSSVTLSAKSESANATYYGFSLENGQAGVLYHSIGINGATFMAYNTRTKFVDQIDALNPDLVIISLGTNDAQGAEHDMAVARKNMVEMIEKLTANGIPVLLTTPIESYKTTYKKKKPTRKINPNIEVFSSIITEQAAESGVAYWDMYAACGGAGASQKWSEAGLFHTDLLHLTPEGYHLQGAMLARAICRAIVR